MRLFPAIKTLRAFSFKALNWLPCPVQMWSLRAQPGLGHGTPKQLAPASSSHLAQISL